MSRGPWDLRMAYLRTTFANEEGIAYRSSKRPLTDFPSFPLFQHRLADTLEEEGPSPSELNESKGDLAELKDITDCNTKRV